jgi:4-hydroxybenzoate polyprenyltransferase/phosphoserine phosphatase
MHPETLVPLVVDLDGTLTPTDTLVESVVLLAKRSPSSLILFPLWLMQGRAAFKHEVASRTAIAAENLPYHKSLLDYLRAEKARGRRIVLATAANRSIADAVARHLDLFDQVLASDETLNLKGVAKLGAIAEAVGNQFTYVGNSSADLPIWRAATKAAFVGSSRDLAKMVQQHGTPIEKAFSWETANLRAWFRALRIRQWIKNLLLFVPLLTAFAFADMQKLASTIVGFFAFSLAASATYIANDILDLESDRAHPTKQYRPFACAQIAILNGVAVAAALVMLAFVLAATVSLEFSMVILIYLLLTTAYSWVLKVHVLIDVLALSVLYTLRIFAGSVAAGVATSASLLAFSVFLFLSLALIKRCSELVALRTAGGAALAGRDYRVADLVVLWPLGVSAAVTAVEVFGLFIYAPETQARYATPQLLWLVVLGLIYWLGRLWFKTSRGQMHDDPVVYAVKDRGSRITILAMVAAVLVAHFFSLGSAR